MLPNQIFEPIVELCTFFRVICSKVLHDEDLKILKQSIVVTLCKLEKIFPPGFFDSMEHLVIHLTNEAIIGGPMQFRWMYPYERKLGRLKRTIRNRARVEGSIVESYLVDELSTYCSLYFEPTVKTRLNIEPRNFAPNIACSSSSDSRLSIFKHPCRRLFEKGGKSIVFSDKDKHKAHTYILLNCQDLHDAQKSFDEHLRASYPNVDQATLDKEKESSFAKWLQLHVISDPQKAPLRDIAQGPLTYVQSHKGYLVNGYKFHTQTAYHGRVTQNSSVCVKGAFYNGKEIDYYGLLDEILEVEYHTNLGSCVVLFKCTWFDPVKGVRIDKKTNMVDVKPKETGCVHDPFILASQAQQVYYTPYPSKEKGLRDWWAVVKTAPRGVYELAEDPSEVGDEDNEDMEDVFQENERLVCTTTNDDFIPITHVQEELIEEVNDLNDDDGGEEVEYEDTTLDGDDVEVFEDDDSN